MRPKRLTKELVERKLEELRSRLQACLHGTPTICREDIEAIFGVKKRWSWEIIRGCGLLSVGKGPATEWRFPEGPIVFHEPANSGRGGKPHDDA